ncbi:DsbA family protein [Pseudochrobactrum sp. HB0163]|uniref:DsbA family protein n=1 Tax=Pseudochrobactrum sp. HB0163 TaxID=3450708 RepID=UPI003F6DDE63
MHRRQFLQVAAGIAVSASLAFMVAETAEAQDVDVNGILYDPEAPVGGNPKGDLTIVVFSDYNCPFCKKSGADLARVVKEDGNIRLVYKEWPILTEASVYGSQLALAAMYQGKYEQVHKALMAIPGSNVSKKAMLDAVKASGVDMKRLQADLNKNNNKITAQLKRVAAQADSIGVEGTPTHLIGPFRAMALDYNSFKLAIADARAREKAAK